jgi:protein involved in polysaccharide export with SLBB domain
MKFGEGRSLGRLLIQESGVRSQESEVRGPRGRVLTPDSRLLTPGLAGSLRTLSRLSLGLSLGLLVGCAAGPPRFDQALMADKGALARNQGVEQAYHVFCPDVLEIRIDSDYRRVGWAESSRPTWNNRAPIAGVVGLEDSAHPTKGQYAIDADGRIDLGRLRKLRVEGRSVMQIADLLAAEFGLPVDRIHVKVAQYNSKPIYLYGQVMPAARSKGGVGDGETGRHSSLSPPISPSPILPFSCSQRAVPYQGPETVLDLLQRVGGITPGAASNDVSVVRSRLADNEPPLVFHIDLQAIVMSQDQRTNLRLQPFDRVFVGEAKKSSLEKCLPPFVRPLYEKLCGIRRPGSFSYGDPLPVQNLKATLAARSTSGQATIFRGAEGE